MKKWLVLLIAFGLLVVYVSSHFVVAQSDDNSGNDDDNSGSGNGDDVDDDSDSDDDSDDDDSDENEIEIEAEVGDGKTKIEIEIGENEQEVIVEGELTEEEVVAKVMELTDLSEETIRANLEYEVKESDSDDDGVDDDTEEEVKGFSENLGAEMRFLQLEYSIKRRILWMNAVIDRLSEGGKDVSELEPIVAEMGVLADEAENVDFSLSDEELVQLFIDIKKDARALVSDFRMTVRPMLDDFDRNALRLRFEQVDRDELREIRNNINERRREYNGARVEELLEDFGESDAELVRRVKAGLIESEQTRRELRIKIENKNEELREEIRIKIREAAERRKAEIRQRLESYADGVGERVEMRVRERLREIGETDVEARIREEVKIRG